MQVSHGRTPVAHALLGRMIARDPDEEGRSATRLELFFDLVFVVAVSIASHELLVFFEEDHYVDGIIRYLMVFFAIWWTWMNFTWFATEYEIDDWLYRVMTLVQMAGLLVMAGGIPDAMHDLDPAVLITGYVTMRMALVLQWVRAAIQSPETRQRCLRYAVGVTLVQVMWIAAAVVGWTFALPFFLVAVLLELAVPLYAERAVSTRWHPHHLTERYGLFTMIVLGESVLASVNSVIAALEEADQQADIIRVAVLGFIVVAAMWWVYFAAPHANQFGELRQTVLWGYGHYVIYAAAAAVSVAISLELADQLHPLEVSEWKMAAAFCVPVAIFVTVIWVLALRHVGDRLIDAATAGVVVTLLLAMATPVAIEITTAAMVLLVVVLVYRLGNHVEHTPAGSHAETH